MARGPRTLTVRPPIGGVVRKLGFQDQGPFTTTLSKNFWSIDAASGRLVSATRPPLDIVNPPGAGVNMLLRVNGDNITTPQQVLLAAFAGNIHWAGPDLLWEAIGSGEGVHATRPLSATPFLLRAVIAAAPDPLVVTLPSINPIVAASLDKISGLAGAVGTTPTNNTVVVTWQGAIWFIGDPANPHILRGSRVNVIQDHDTSETDLGAAWASTGENEGLIQSPGTALVPFTDDTMLIAGEDELWIALKHPRQGGEIHLLPSRVGILGQQAWTSVPGNRVFFMSKAGLMEIQSGEGVPTPVSAEKIPDDLVGLTMDLANPTINVEYDVRWDSVFITDRGMSPQAWSYHLPTQSFMEMEFSDYPTILFGYDPMISEDASGTLFAGVGYGGLARFDRTGTEDFTFEQRIGPVKISPTPYSRSVVRSARFVFGSETASTSTLQIFTGTSVEDVDRRVTDNDTARRFEVSVGTLLRNNGVCYPQLGGHACVINLSGTTGISGARVILEEVPLVLTDGGAERGRSLPTADPAAVVDAGVDQTVEQDV